VTAEVLPLFPLNTVLFPGVPLSLHVFEHRYRLLVSTLVDGPAPRRFGVVAIKQGLEVGEDETPVLHAVGCVADLRRVDAYEDGRYDLVTFGGPRFRVVETDDTLPYLRASVTYLPDVADGADAGGVVTAFGDYCRAVADAVGEEIAEPALPEDDPVLVSYVVASAMRLDLPEKQSLLEVPDTRTRLRTVLSLLRRETALLGAVPDEVPTEGPFSLN
jgi:Lon protease-like protein